MTNNKTNHNLIVHVSGLSSKRGKKKRKRKAAHSPKHKQRSGMRRKEPFEENNYMSLIP